MPLNIKVGLANPVERAKEAVEETSGKAPVKRTAAGKVWEDPSLAEWNPSNPTHC